jgi:hypothetical protein
MRRVFLIIALSLEALFLASAQEDKKVIVNGYVTSMQTVTFDSLKGSFINDNLIHNRLNFKGYFGNHVSMGVELRSRIFTGDMVRMNPGYSDMIGKDQGWIDLSWNIADEKSFLINTTIDRYWLDINYSNIQVRLGRQRINWGQTFVWNPNDIFNAYSFFDVDYPERPGGDAIRIQYFPDYTSALELAVKADYEDDVTAAALYRFNKWGYDIQFLAGYVNSEDYVAGAGWSGAFRSLSFRGEVSWFQPVRHFSDTIGTGLFTIGFDRILKDNSMIQLQAMYCNNPLDLTDFNSFYTGNLSAKDLAFSKFSIFGQFNFAATPLLNLSISGMWFPGLKGYFAGPSVDYSVAENIDFSLIWQHFKGRMGEESLRINLGFLRLKYNF